MENNPSNRFSKPAVPPKTRRSEGCEKPDSHSAELRPVYAAYLNMAQMNLFDTLMYIGKKVDVVDKVKASEMDQMKIVHYADLVKPELVAKVREELERSIPFLFKLLKDGREEPTNEDVSRTLGDIIKIIDYRRNEYTHTQHKRNNAKDEESRLLSVKKKAEGKDTSFKPLQTALMLERKAVAQEMCLSKKEMEFIDKEAYLNMGDDDNALLSDMDIAFLICKLLQKKYAYQFLQQSKLFTSRGKGGHSPFSAEKNKVLARIFCSDTIKLPKGRIEVESNDPKAALGIDMLNELQKCPDELYRTLSKDGRELFVVDGLADGEYIEMKRHGDRFPILALRYIDELDILNGMAFQVRLGTYRYKFYNKKAIDANKPNRVRILQKEINGFGPIQKMEPLRKENYKNLIRWTEQEEEYTRDTANTKPYLTNSRTSYIINSNRIGLTWNDLGQNILDEKNCFLPTIPTPQKNGDDWTVEWPRGGCENNENCQIPKCWLSVYDLPALLFLHHLGGDPSGIIKGFRENMLRLLVEIAEGSRKAYFGTPLPGNKDERKTEIKRRKGELDTFLRQDYCWEIDYNAYCLQVRNLPVKIVDYLIGISGGSREVEEAKAETDFNNWAKEKVCREIQEIQKIKNSIERAEQDNNDKKKRTADKEKIDLRPGKLAQYLAKDIMKMQPADMEKNHQGKLTGFDYDVMQGAIATYTGSTVECKHTKLGELFSNAGLIDSTSKNKHPFLDKVMEKRISGTLDFYKKYLNEKEKYLKNVRDSKSFKEAYFLHDGLNNHKAKDLQYIRELALRYKDTLQLPDGLFTEAIVAKLKRDNVIKTHIKDLSDSQLNNAAYLIRVYFEEKYKDKSQPFYLSDDPVFKRYYKLSENKGEYKSEEEICKLLQQLKKEKKNNNDDYRKRLNFCRDNEKAIRRYKTQDMLLFLMSKDLLFKQRVLGDKFINSLQDFKLSNIQPIGREDGPKDNTLNQQISSLTVKVELWKENKSTGLKKEISCDDLKLKNIGDFYRMVFDPRVGYLLSLFDDKTFKQDDIRRELEVFDNSRVEVFSIVHRIENAIYKDNKNEIDDYVREETYIGFREMIEKYSRYDAQTKENIIAIRNMVSHNNYMDKDEIVKIIPKDKIQLPQVMSQLVEWLRQHA